MNRRILTILLGLFFICTTLFAQNQNRQQDYNLAKTLESLTSTQRSILFQYGTLEQYGTPETAATFWATHKTVIPQVQENQKKILAQELLANTTLVYEVKKPSQLQALRGVFTTSRILIGIAALVAAYALISILRSYWSRIFAWLFRNLAPLFRIIFSPRLLTYELLILGIIGIWLGADIASVVLRTIVVHIGLFLLWGLLTAVISRNYDLNNYTRTLKYNLDDNSSYITSFFEISIPAFITTGAIIWLHFTTQDPWFSYEVSIPALVGLSTFPLVRWAEKPLSRILFPIQGSDKFEFRRFTAMVVITLIIWGILWNWALLLQPVLETLTLLLILSMIFLSWMKVSNEHLNRYFYIQIITLLYCIASILLGSQFGLVSVLNIGLGGLVFFIVFKYWEIPTLFGWSWKDRKAWGILGMAFLLWVIAQLMLWVPQWFSFI